MDALKVRKVCEDQSVCDGEDKVSQLPDCILHHILSFLATREAVATGILSTRWKYLWASVSKIDFDDSFLYSNRVSFWYPLQVSCFMNFVERVLLLRESSDVQRFRLSCRVCFSATRVHAWLSAAIRHNVEELDLCLFVDETFVLPRCVFNSRSLKVVKLEMNCILQLPSCISFPCLRILHLCLITFPDDNSTQRLFSSCPVLQELVLLDCEWMHLKTISIFIPSLKSLIIDDLPIFGLSDDLRGCEIKIDAENLVFLGYSGVLCNEISLYNTPSSVHASIHTPLSRHKREKGVADHATKLFRALKNVNLLRISCSTIESITLANAVPHHPLVFQNLTQLELSMELEKHTALRLLEFLRCLPKLETLCFLEGLSPLMSQNGDDSLNSVPTCFLASLKNVILRSCHGNDVEIQFLKTLLKQAPILERMRVFPSRNSLRDPKKKKEFRDQLQMLPRSLMQCAIMLF